MFVSGCVSVDRTITTQGEGEQAPLQPVQLVRSGFQKYKPNLGKGFRRKELQIPENNEDKKSEADNLEVQKTQSAHHVSATVSLLGIATLPSKM